jgi:hypothetical protein
MQIGFREDGDAILCQILSLPVSDLNEAQAIASPQPHLIRRPHACVAKPFAKKDRL